MRARFTTILLTCGVILPGVVFFLLHVTGPSDGTRLAPGQPVWQTDGVIVTPLQPGGLRQGDVIVAVEGKSLESWAQGLFRWDLARLLVFWTYRSCVREDGSDRISAMSQIK